MIELTTAVEKEIDFGLMHVTNPIVPAESTGELLDVIIEDGEICLLLDFEEYEGYEWYELNEIEEAYRYDAQKRRDIVLTTAVKKHILKSGFTTISIMPGSTGAVIGVIIEKGKISFLLEFEEYGISEWYESNEVEDKC